LVRRRRRIYSKAELNRLLDDIMHPPARNNPFLVLADGVLHFIIERDPYTSTLKFVKYSLPEIIEQIIRNSKRRRANHA